MRFYPDVQVLEPSAVQPIVHQVHAPALVDERPAEDAGVIAIPIEHARERLLLARTRACAGKSDVGQLCPDEQADAIRRLVVARIRHLEMTAQRIEPKLLGLAKLILQECNRRHGTDRLGIIVLVESRAQIKRLAVEVKLAVSSFDCAKAEVIAHCIDRHAVASACTHAGHRGEAHPVTRSAPAQPASLSPCLAARLRRSSTIMPAACPCGSVTVRASSAGAIRSVAKTTCTDTSPVLWSEDTRTRAI